MRDDCGADCGACLRCEDMFRHEEEAAHAAWVRAEEQRLYDEAIARQIEEDLRYDEEAERRAEEEGKAGYSWFD